MPEPPLQPTGAEQGCPQPGPQRARPTRSPKPETRQARHLRTRKGAGGPRGSGGGGAAAGSAAPRPLIWSVSGLGPGGGRSPGAPAPAAARGGRREAGAVRWRGRSRRFAAGSRLRWALSCSQRRLRWRARPAVTSARLPRPPLLTPTRAERRGRRRGARGAQPGSPALPSPARAPPAFPGESRRHGSPSSARDAGITRGHRHQPGRWRRAAGGKPRRPLSAQRSGLLWGEWRGDGIGGCGGLLAGLQKCPLG